MNGRVLFFISLSLMVLGAFCVAEYTQSLRLGIGVFFVGEGLIIGMRAAVMP